MSTLSRKIDGVQTLGNFTAKVVQDNNPKRYNNTTSVNTVFSVGTEYMGPNFFKNQQRKPRLRVLSVFRPLVGGSTNAGQDTYVAFSVFDYSLNIFRGPACRRANQNAAIVYNSFYVTTIDNFGKNYGNTYTGLGSSNTPFTAPALTFSNNATLSVNSGSLSVNIKSGHYNGAFIFGSNGSHIDFNGFIRLTGHNSVYCLYAITDSGAYNGFNNTKRVFNNTKNDQKYRTNQYPYLSSLTGKFDSEWRCAPFCGLNTAHFTPLVRPTNRGTIKYVGNFGDPSMEFPGGLTVTTDIWVTVDDVNYLDFFNRVLYADNAGEGNQGEYGFADSGFYGPTDNDSYSYWNGTAWTGGVFNYGGAPPPPPPPTNFQQFIFLGPFASFDLNGACTSGLGSRPSIYGYVDLNAYPNLEGGAQVFYDAQGTSPITEFDANFIYAVWNTEGKGQFQGFAAQFAEGDNVITNNFYC